MVDNPFGVVLYLGAGASAWAGYRTFLTFPSMFWPSGNLPSALEVADKERALLDEIKIHLIKRHLSLTLDNYLARIHEYRSVTSKVMSNTTLRDRMLSTTLQWAGVQELRRSLMTIRERICQLTATHYRRPPRAALRQFELVYSFYRKMAMESAGQLSVFTSNYDLIPEYLFADNRTLRKTWFGEQEPSEDSPMGKIYTLWRQQSSSCVLRNGFCRFDAADLTKHTARPGRDGEVSKAETLGECEGKPICTEAGFCSHPSCGDGYPDCAKNANGDSAQDSAGMMLYYYRLHGCVGWCQGEVGDPHVYFDVQQPGDLLSFADRLYVSYMGHDQSYGDHPLNIAFKALDEVVTGARALVFVGFSFRDDEIVGAIGRALYRRKENLPPIIVIDPQMTQDELSQRLKRSGHRVTGPLIDWSKLTCTIVSEHFPSDNLSESVMQVVDEYYSRQGVGG